MKFPLPISKARSYPTSNFCLHLKTMDGMVFNTIYPNSSRAMWLSKSLRLFSTAVCVGKKGHFINTDSAPERQLGSANLCWHLGTSLFTHLLQVGSSLYEQGCQLHVSSTGCKGKGWLEGIGWHVDLRAAVQQQPCHLHMAVLGQRDTQRM